MGVPGRVRTGRIAKQELCGKSGGHIQLPSEGVQWCGLWACICYAHGHSLIRAKQRTGDHHTSAKYRQLHG
jgi:hypothetical protein